MKEKIIEPKVFISYAWATKAYEEKVLAFATQLISDGIDVVLDKWDMAEGNDTNAFMERCVNDPSITNVLMLIDPVYARKANEHTGGVGTETQIISAKVYKSVTQDRFIPVVFERDSDGSICKPTYLEGRLHFDLTEDESYDETYQRLVRTLFGEDTYPKPKIGTKPAWVDQPTIAVPRTIVAFDVLKRQSDDKVQSASFASFINGILDRIIQYSNATEQPNSHQELISIYDETKPVRLDYLTLLSYSIYVRRCESTIAGFFEDLSDAVSDIYTSRGALTKVFIHELYIYTIAHFWYIKDYKAVGYLLNHTYFTRRYNLNDSGARNYQLFYSGSDHTSLDEAVCAVTGKKYYSGTAQHWVTNVCTEYCTKEKLVFADLLCFNYAAYGKNYISDWAWFPITYCYDNEYKSSIARIARKLVSKEYVELLLPVFGFDSVSSFVDKFKQVQESKKYGDFRYRESFDPAHLLGYFIKAEEIATLP